MENFPSKDQFVADWQGLQKLARVFNSIFS